MCTYSMLQSRNGPYIIFPLPVDNQSYFTLFDIIFQPVFPISFIYLFSHYTILMRIHVVLWSSGNSWNSWRCFCLCQTRISGTMKCYAKLSSMKIFAKCLIFRVMCFTIYGPKKRYFCEISFTKHFQSSRNCMPVRVCING